MTKVILLLIASITALSTLTGNSEQPHQDKSPQQTSQTAVPATESVIKVTIATVGSFLGPPTDHYKVGDQIPVTITMTNNSSAPSLCAYHQTFTKIFLN